MDEAASRTDSVGGRHRLAAIVGVDIIGYSALTETDEAGAVRAVADLGALVSQEAAAHGGRVFNTAGDGFMLEFPTASGALEAAEAIAARADPPVRTGVHLGDVTVAADGDLLGHGVNVAARLQTLARAGVVLVSDSVRRAATGPVSRRLVAQGRVRLDKMNETVEVFALDTRRSGRKPALLGGLVRRAPRAWPVLAAAGLLIVLLLAGLAYWTLGRPQGLQVAVTPFTAGPADTASQAVAAALPGQIVGVLTDRQAPTVSLDAAARPGRGGARLVVSGAVERDDGTLRVHVTLDDRRSGRSLWSGVYQRPSADADALEAQVAAKVGDIVDQAARALGKHGGDIDSETLAAYLSVSDRKRSGPRGSALQNIDADRRIVARAPTFAAGHAALAFDLAITANTEPPGAAATLRGEARTQAARALALNPALGDPYVALAELERPDSYAAREHFLTQGLTVDPQNAAVNNYLGDLLRGVGRLREAQPLYQRGLALDPLSPAKTASNIFGLAGVGDLDGAEQLARRAERLFPDHVVVGRARVYTAVIYGDPDLAAQRLRRLDKPERLLGPQAVALWLDYVAARRRGVVAPALLGRIAAAANADVIDPTAAVSALAQSGDVDAAFAVANAAADRGAPFYVTEFYAPADLALRRDRRFMPLADRFRLTAYWLGTGSWPDFCARPGLDYACKDAAAKAEADRPR